MILAAGAGQTLAAVDPALLGEVEVIPAGPADCERAAAIRDRYRAVSVRAQQL